MNSVFSINQITKFRVTAESAFYTNNVKKIDTVKEMYELALKNPGTIVLDQKIYEAEKLGLPKNSHTLVFNDGFVAGRAAAARRILGDEGIDPEYYSSILREAVYAISKKETNYHVSSYIGLHEDFIIKANLLVPKGFENTALSWLLNFQEINKKYENMYNGSKKLDENEIFVVSDPDWSHPDFPYGLTFFSPLENTAFILGMRYFGEFKKGTLTLAWCVADRNGYASCHGGLKHYEDLNYVSAFFGLSGSGKSTLTHAKHNGKYKITILHDDAFIINNNDHSSIALEPSYFDKTSDYKIGEEDNKYILTAQNVGVCCNAKGEKIIITEDIRNSNGRAVKSRFWSPNRVDKIEKNIDAIFWLMKDSSIPPVLEINNSSLAAVMGATLATKRTSAERLAKGVDPDALVIEPFANPFRTYPLSNDYNKFKALFDKGVKCYVLNTGFFMNEKVKATHTISIIERLASRDLNNLEKLFGLDVMKFTSMDIKLPNSKEWKDLFKKQINSRIDFVKKLNNRDKLPEDALSSLESLISKI